MKIEFEGRPWALALEDFTLQQGIAIQDYMGMSVADWLAVLDDVKSAAWLKALAPVYWLMYAQNGEDAGPLAAVDFSVLKFAEAFIGAAAEEAGAGALPDPTRPAGGRAAASPAARSRKPPGSPGSPTPT